MLGDRLVFLVVRPAALPPRAHLQYSEAMCSAGAPQGLFERLRAHRVRLVPKRESRLMRLAALPVALLGNRNFMARYWTTVGRTVYYPESVRDPWAHPDVLEHELVHVRQWERLGVLFWLGYLLLPLPVGLAWFRFYFEREAYLVQLAGADPETRERTVERIVDTLWYGYGYPWPRPLMRRWFLRKAATARESWVCCSSTRDRCSPRR